MNLQDLSASVAYCQRVGKLVKTCYSIDDGNDHCFHLMESGSITLDTPVSEAAHRVAQDIQQA